MVQYKEAVDGLSESEAKLALKSAGLSKAQQDQILNYAILNSSTELFSERELELSIQDKLLSDEKIATAKASLEEAIAQEKVNEQTLIALSLKEGEIGAAARKILVEKSETVENIKLTASQKAYNTVLWETVKAKLAAAAANPLTWVVGGVAAIWLAIKAYKKWGDTLENAKKKAEEAESKYNNLKSELDSLNSELKITQDRIKELNSLDSLSITEKEELDNLEAENKALEYKIELLKEQASIAKNEAADAIKHEYEKAYQETNQTVKNHGKNDERIKEINAQIAELENKYTKRALIESPNLEAAKEYNKLLEERNRLESTRLEKQVTKEELINDQLSEYQALLKEYKDNPSLFVDKKGNDSDKKKRLDELKKQLVDEALEIQDYIERYGIDDEWSREKHDIYLGINYVLYPDKNKSEIINNAIDSLDDSILKELQHKVENGESIDIPISLSKGLSEYGYTVDEILDEIKAKFRKTSEEIIKETKHTRREMIDEITDLSDGFDILDDIYADVLNGGTFDFTNLSKKKFEEAFKGLETEYEDFIETVSKNPDSIGANEEAFNNLVTAYVNHSKVLNDLTEDNAELTIAMLTNMGVSNAKEVVDETLAQKEKLAAYGAEELTEKTYGEANAFIDGLDAADNIKEGLAQLAIEKIHLNGIKIDTSAEVEELVNLAKTAGASAKAITDVRSAMSILENAGRAGYTTAEQRAWAQKVLDDVNAGKYFEFENKNEEFKLKTSFEYSGGDKSKNLKDSAEKFDWIEVAISRVQRAVTNLDKTVSATWKNWGSRNSALSSELSKVSDEMNLQKAAFDKYLSEAQKIPLSNYYKNLIMNGGLNISEITDETTKKQINEFKEYYEKALAASDAIEDLKGNLVDLAKTKFDNISKVYSDLFGVYENSKDLISKQIDLFSEAGELIGEAFYETQKNETQKQLSILENEKKELANQLSLMVSSGLIEKGSEAWNEMISSLNEVDGSILDCKKSIEELDNSILELHTQVFERIQNQFNAFGDEIENVIGLIDHLDVATENGEWTTEGLTQLGLLTQQYELAQYRVEQYANEIEKLNSDYALGRYSTTEYVDKLIELKNAQWESVNAAESAKDAIENLNKAKVDLVKEGIQKEIDAYKKLIDEQIKSLQNERDLRDWENSLKESTDNITKLEKQLSALSGDNSASAIAKRKKLEEELAKAREDLEEKQYEHSIKSQEDALNQQYEDYEKTRNDEVEKLEESLKDHENIIAKSFESVKQNSEKIGSEIESLALQHGVKISKSLTDAWKSGENSIANYGTVLSRETSAFVRNIIDVELETWNLQSQANVTAVSLSNMFATKADGLVSEISNSIISENILGNTTNTLINQFQNLFNGQYSNGLTDALGSVTDKTKELISEIERLKKENADLKSGFNDNSAIGEGTLVQLYDSTGKKVGDPMTAEQAEAYIKKNKKTGYTYKKVAGYATGIHNLTKDELAWTQELGREMILSPTRDSVLTPLKSGDTVLTKEQTDNMFEWSKVNPGELLNKSLLRPISLEKTIQPTSLQIGNLVTVNGNIDDTNIKRMQTVAQNAVYDAFKKFNAGINK